MVISILLIIFSILLSVAIWVYWPIKKANLEELHDYEKRLGSAVDLLNSNQQELAYVIDQKRQINSDIEGLNLIKENTVKSMDEAAELMSMKYKQAELDARLQYEQIINGLAEEATTYANSANLQRKTNESLKKSELAYIESKKKEEEGSKDKILLDEDVIHDVELLKETSKDMRTSAVPLYKMIWNTYYKNPTIKVLNAIAPTGSKKVGIYKITEIDSGKMYIGQSNDVRNRISDHCKSGLGIDASSNALYTEMFKVGPHNFTYELLEECEPEELNDKEKYWIDFFNATKNGFNQTAGGATKRKKKEVTNND